MHLLGRQPSAKTEQDSNPTRDSTRAAISCGVAPWNIRDGYARDPHQGAIALLCRNKKSSYRSVSGKSRAVLERLPDESVGMTRESVFRHWEGFHSRKCSCFLRAAKNRPDLPPQLIFYCKIVVSVQFGGAVVAVPVALKRITPEASEQKPRCPVVPMVIGVAVTT